MGYNFLPIVPKVIQMWGHVQKALVFRVGIHTCKCFFNISCTVNIGLFVPVIVVLDIRPKIIKNRHQTSCRGKHGLHATARTRESHDLVLLVIFNTGQLAVALASMHTPLVQPESNLAVGLAFDYNLFNLAWCICGKKLHVDHEVLGQI